MRITLFDLSKLRYAVEMVFKKMDMMDWLKKLILFGLLILVI